MKYEQVMVMRIRMASHEYDDNTPMKGLAEACFNTQIRQQIKDTGIPYVVFVQEHGGWWLGYTLIDGVVETVYSANDRSEWSEKKKAFREAAYHAKWVELGEVRRPEREPNN